MESLEHYNKVLKKIVKYCAFQDRCFAEVRAKIEGFELSLEEEQSIVDYLVSNKYLDEERYVRSIVRGKFVYNQWGKIKIEHLLNQKEVSSSLFDKVWEELINPQEYEEVIVRLVDKKVRSVKAKDDFELRQKIIASMYQKGFESYIVEPLVDDVLHRGV